MKLVNVFIATLSLVGGALSAAVPIITDSAVQSLETPDTTGTVSAVGDVHVTTHDVGLETSISVDTYISVGELIPTPSIESVSCDHTWCQEGVSMCIYWAGTTGWDVSLGPVPGMTHTTFDEPCSATELPITSSISDRELFGEEMSTVNPRGPGSGSLRRFGPTSSSIGYGDEDCTDVVESLVTEAPALPTEAPCHHLYCEDGTYYCHYWGGITGYDEFDNPIPGMTSTSVGSCSTIGEGEARVTAKEE